MSILQGHPCNSLCGLSVRNTRGFMLHNQQNQQSVDTKNNTGRLPHPYGSLAPTTVQTKADTDTKQVLLRVPLFSQHIRCRYPPSCSDRSSGKTEPQRKTPENNLACMVAFPHLDTRTRIWQTPHSLKSSSLPNRWWMIARFVPIPPASAIISFNTTTQLATT